MQFMYSDVADTYLRFVRRRRPTKMLIMRNGSKICVRLLPSFFNSKCLHYMRKKNENLLTLVASVENVCTFYRMLKRYFLTFFVSLLFHCLDARKTDEPENSPLISKQCSFKGRTASEQ